MKKTILIDLGKLKHRFSGLGEVSFCYAQTLVSNLNQSTLSNIEFTFLVPHNWFGKFGNDVKYLPLNFFRRHFPFINKRYDIWHAIHQDSAYMPALGKTKYLITVHDLFATKRLNATYQKIKKAKVVTTISNFTKEEIIKKWNYNLQITTLYNGVSNFTKIKTVKPNGINENENFFFHISSLMPKKNIAALLKMMQLMPNKKLVIVGNWNNNFGLALNKVIVNLNLTNVIRLSNINDAEKAWLYANCSAFMFPSFLEGFGLPVIEAMHFGKPVFISTLSSLPEVGGEAAFYFENFEANYMQQLVNDKMKEVEQNPNFGEVQKKQAANFTWQKNVEGYLEIYKALLSES